MSWPSDEHYVYESLFAAEGTRSFAFQWMPELHAMACVRGCDLWAQAQKHRAHCKLSSVLIGLEGSAPGKKSPFGVKHTASGTAGQVSALGNRKWSSFKANNACQIPAKEGGIRMRITSQMFNEVTRICEELDLVNPTSECCIPESRVRSRGFLVKSFLEKELFKQILAGNSDQARKAVGFMSRWCHMAKRAALP